jgi:outer membrane receptor protein involved in Fe transport
MKNIKIFMVVVSLVFGLNAIASTNASKNHKLYGIVVDATNGNPLEYATVKLLKITDSALLTGTVSNLNGEFLLETKLSGEFLLQVNYLGYEVLVKSISIKESNRNIDLGIIRLKPAAENIAEITVKANKNAIDYQIDKKVIHVSQQYTAVSGSAVDVLQSAPSVQVDVEGNVALRGNSNFTVLIDGRPTVLEATEALEQIPAGMIQDIEIITNPSAKYDPEGTAGIINIVTKKRSLEGMSGIAHLNMGLDEKYGADILLNYRTEHFNYFISADYNKRNYPGTSEEETRYIGAMPTDTTFYLTAYGDRVRGRERYSFRGGIEWFPNESNTFSLSGRFGDRSHKWKTETDFSEWNSFEPDKINYYSLEDGGRGGYFYSLTADYVHQFSGPKHKFDMNLMVYNRDGDDETVNTLRNEFGDITNSQISGEFGPSSGFRYRANYMQPISKLVNIEAGLQGRYRDAKETNEVFYYDTVNLNYVFQPEYSNDVQYLRNIHAAYALSSGEWNSFGYQVGLRAEYTFREIKLNNTGESFDIDRIDFFPTIHFSYKLNDKNQFMASYSRRIDRPRGWFLEPFITWEDAYNVRSGNPNLKPEYINAYELGYQLTFGKHALSTELYYRSTVNNIERIRRKWEDANKVTYATFENVGNDHSLGTEVMLNIKATKWWDADITGNFYDYRVEGELDGESFDKHSFTYTVRMNNTFSLFENTNIQFNPAYEGPEIEPQEEEKGYFRADGAIRQSFLQKKLQFTLQVRDIFATAKWESTTDTETLYNHRLRDYRSPIVMLNITWRINNYKSKRGEGGMENGGGMGEE